MLGKVEDYFFLVGSLSPCHVRKVVPGRGVDVWWTEEEITSSQRENDAEGEFPIGACPESDEKKKFWMSVSPFSDGCVCVLRPLERVYIKKVHAPSNRSLEHANNVNWLRSRLYWVTSYLGPHIH